MNAAFLLTAVLLIAGLLLTRHAWGAGKAIRAGQAMMLLGAGGLGLAGAFPADRNPGVHMAAALMVFGCGNAGLVLAGFAPRGTVLARLRAPTLILGLLGLTGTVLFFKEIGLGIGIGGMERVAVFPLLIWCCLAGCYRYASLTRGGTTRATARPVPALQK